MYTVISRGEIDTMSTLCDGTRLATTCDEQQQTGRLTIVLWVGMLHRAGTFEEQCEWNTASQNEVQDGHLHLHESTSVGIR